MRHPLLSGLAALTLLLVPGRAAAQWSARLALEAPLWVETPSSTYNISQTFQPAVDVLGSFVPWDAVSLDVELRVGIAATGGYARQRFQIGPGLTLDLPTFPLYGRVSFPVQVEDGTVLFGRVGGGLKVTDWGFFRVYLELTVDAALAGKGVSAFDRFAVNAGIGVWFRL
jgi:hypothetical protein